MYLINKQKNEYCEITFIRKVPIFVVFVGRLIHEVKNPTNNETWEAARHQYMMFEYIQNKIYFAENIVLLTL
jgi:hypothetical protein